MVIQNFLANKRLGQNFLLKNEFIDKFQSSLRSKETESVYANSLVIEVGAGLASLSKRILKSNPKKLISIEIDERFTPLLADLKRSYPEKFDYIVGDAQDQNLMFEMIKEKAELSNGSYPLIQIVGNLPFAISGTLLSQWSKQSLEKSGVFGMCDDVHMSLIFSKNVGEKLLPTFNKRTRFSTVTQTAFDVSAADTYSRKEFNPVPKCDAIGLRFINRKARIFEDSEQVNFYIKWLKSVYSLPNKTAKKAFKDIANVKEHMTRLGISPSERLFAVPIYKLVKLSNSMFQEKKQLLN